MLRLRLITASGDEGKKGFNWAQNEHSRRWCDVESFAKQSKLVILGGIENILYFLLHVGKIFHLSVTILAIYRCSDAAHIPQPCLIPL